MKKIMSILSLLAISSSAFAINDPQLDANAFKAVADAVVAQHQIASDQSINAIIRGKESFGIKLKNSNDKCVEISATLMVAPAGPATQYSVTFNRLAPTPVECD